MSPNPAQVIVVSAVLVSLASLAVALRLYVRSRQRTSIGVDDWTIVLALVCSHWNCSEVLAGSITHYLQVLTWLLSILLIVGTCFELPLPSHLSR